MVINFLKVTLHNLYREKYYSLINILGLSLAIASCVILGLYLRMELTYDQHNINHKRIFRVALDKRDGLGLEREAQIPELWAPQLANYSLDIKEYVRIFPPNSDTFRYEDKTFSWNNISFADPNLFKVFTHNIIYGNPETALDDPASVAVSESFARKYFGNTNPIGKVIANDKSNYKITLVFADLPENTHLKYDAILPIIKGGNRFIYLYLLMPEGYDVREFDNVSSIFFKHKNENKDKDFIQDENMWLQPLAGIHLQSGLKRDQPMGDKFTLYGFTIVALFILIVACINYMNLTTARASKRIKEVVIRKILGANRIHLIFQFLGESILLSLIALIFGLFLVEFFLCLTPINELLGKTLALNLGHEPGLIGWLLILGFLVGLMSGIYPAIYLSSLSALATGNQTVKGSGRLRKALVLIQFVATVSVISCILIMALQMRYISHKPLGFDKENRIVVTLNNKDIIQKAPIIKTELLKNSHILGASVVSSMPGQPHMGGTMGRQIGSTFEKIKTNMNFVDKDFIKIMGIQLKEGRDYSKLLLTDGANSCIVNETLVKTAGWEEPLGQKTVGNVIGVIKDYHFDSLHNPVEPLALFLLRDPTNWVQRRYLILHLSREEISETIKFLEEKFSEYDPRHPFEFEFLDDSLDKLYLSEQRLMKLTIVFAGICIFISCLGLVGLTAFSTEQRTKEIGIRKVFGAATWEITSMLLRNILLLVSGGAIIASLASYYAMDEWLTGFSYHTGINPMVFIISALIVAGMALIAVASQSIKAARANPVDALRYE